MALCCGGARVVSAMAIDVLAQRLKASSTASVQLPRPGWVSICRPR